MRIPEVKVQGKRKNVEFPEKNYMTQACWDIGAQTDADLKKVEET